VKSSFADCILCFILDDCFLFDVANSIDHFDDNMFKIFLEIYTYKSKSFQNVFYLILKILKNGMECKSNLIFKISGIQA